MLDLKGLKQRKASEEEILRALKDELTIDQLNELCVEYGINFRANTSNKKKYEQAAKFLSTLFMYQRIAGE